MDSRASDRRPTQAYPRTAEADRREKLTKTPCFSATGWRPRVIRLGTALGNGCGRSMASVYRGNPDRILKRLQHRPDNRSRVPSGIGIGVG